MNYYYNEKKDYYIIKMNKQMDNYLFYETVKEILKKEGLQDKQFIYYTFFDSECNYCILDFNCRKININEEINSEMRRK